MNTYGPTRTNSPRGERNFILFINDSTRVTCIMLLKERLEDMSKWKIFKAQVENEKELNIKCFKYERGEEFRSKQFEHFYEKHNMKRQSSVKRTPQQNGVV